MPEVVVNTSPMQYLFQTGLLEILRALYGTVVLPEAVQMELAEGRSRGVALPDPTSMSWITIRSVRNRALLPLVTDLGPESVRFWRWSPRRPVPSRSSTMRSPDGMLNCSVFDSPELSALFSEPARLVWCRR